MHLVVALRESALPPSRGWAAARRIVRALTDHDSVNEFRRGIRSVTIEV